MKVGDVFMGGLVVEVREYECGQVPVVACLCGHHDIQHSYSLKRSESKCRVKGCACLEGLRADGSWGSLASPTLFGDSAT